MLGPDDLQTEDRIAGEGPFDLVEAPLVLIREPASDRGGGATAVLFGQDVQAEHGTEHS